MLTNDQKLKLSSHAKAIRRLVIDAIYQVGTGHAGSSLSMIEILTLLYFHHLRVRPESPSWPDRDFVVLSKGHGSPGLYATLAEANFIPKEEMRTLRQLGTRLHGHPNAKDLPGVDVSTGSLGQGISNSVGLALGLMHQGKKNRVYCIMGDGELQEGENWEAFMAGAHYQLDNLLAIVDRNGLQGDGNTETVMALGDLSAKLNAFGWKVHEVNGHDFDMMDDAVCRFKTNKGGPSVIVANTVKGKGVSYMEGVMKWHHHVINEEQYAIAVSEIERGLK